jgi:hypothetical protein
MNKLLFVAILGLILIAGISAHDAKAKHDDHKKDNKTAVANSTTHENKTAKEAAK